MSSVNYLQICKQKCGMKNAANNLKHMNRSNKENIFLLNMMTFYCGIFVMCSKQASVV